MLFDSKFPESNTCSDNIVVPRSVYYYISYEFYHSGAPIFTFMELDLQLTFQVHQQLAITDLQQMHILLVIKLYGHLHQYTQRPENYHLVPLLRYRQKIYVTFDGATIVHHVLKALYLNLTSRQSLCK